MYLGTGRIHGGSLGNKEISENDAPVAINEL